MTLRTCARLFRTSGRELCRRLLDRYPAPAYDAMYVALAESLGLPLLTDDGKLATASGHTADIHRYPD